MCDPYIENEGPLPQVLFYSVHIMHLDRPIPDQDGSFYRSENTTVHSTLEPTIPSPGDVIEVLGRQYRVCNVHQRQIFEVQHISIYVEDN